MVKEVFVLLISIAFANTSFQPNNSEFEAATPKRLTVQGTQVIDPNTNAPITLHGVNWWSGYFQSADGLDLSNDLPKANVVRLIGILWDNGDAKTDCRTDDASSGYLTAKCVKHLDNAVKAAQRHGIWVIITARAAQAAGDGYPNDVFHDKDLADQYATMWRYVAKRYSTWEWVAGYEIMSEPRTKITSQEDVTAFYSDMCTAIHEVDPATPCVVGPAPYYKIWQINESILLKDTNVIYTFDFFLPWSYITAEDTTKTFPGNYACDDVFKGVAERFCTKPYDQDILKVDQDFLESLLVRFPIAVQKSHPVPMFANQWGVKHEVTAESGRQAYAEAVATIFEKHAIHSTYWIWRSYEKESWGFEIIHQDQNDTVVLSSLNKVWNGEANEEDQFINLDILN